ncbi:MAG: hypothetical protein HY951_12520 [Bacteroidia bacterium]|nr:hypothetical protein [Bacteroidia bacterium]
MKNIKNLILFLICSVSVNTFAQDYKQYSVLSSKVEYFLSENNTDSAIIIYNQIFSTFGKLFPFDNLDAAKAFASKKDTVMTLRIISDMIKYDFKLDEILEDKTNDSIFEFAKKSKLWENLKSVKSEIDFPTFAKINAWIEVDQFIRNRNEDACKYKYMAEIDSINTINVMELINEQGYPGFKTLGYNQDIIILIMHSTTNTSTKHYWESFFKPLLYSEALKGNISFSDYAIVLDRYNYAMNGFQTYGTFRTISDYVPIENIKEVDIRRAELGLSKLSIDAKIKKLQLPEKY